MLNIGRKIKNMNMMIFIIGVLDPQYKFRLVEQSFEELYECVDAQFFSRKVKETYNDIFDRYRLFLNNNQVTNFYTILQSSGNIKFCTIPNTSFAMEFEKNINISESTNKNEVDLYLIKDLEKTTSNFEI